MKAFIILSVFSIRLFLSAAPATAYYEDNARDYLPAISKIEFGKVDIGFIASDGRRMLFNRKARRFAQVPDSKYFALMSGTTEAVPVQETLFDAINKAVASAQPYGFPIKLAVKDPFAGVYWAVTATGLAQLSSDLKPSDLWHIGDAFDDKTGAAIIVISTWAAPTDSLATFQLKLGGVDTKAFYEAVGKIPQDVRACFDWQALSGLPSGDCPASSPSEKGRFLPSAFNVLVPFVIRSADFSPDNVWRAAHQLCLFRDKAAVSLLADNVDSGYFMTRTGGISQCLAWYQEAGLLPEKFTPERLERSLKRIKTDLAAGDTERMSWGHTRALDAAKGLAEFGNPEGIDLLNKYFNDSPGGIDAPGYAFFGDAAQALHYRDEFLPAVLAGIRKFYGMTVPQGCLYLDLTYGAAGKNRRGLKQLAALVEAVENATHPEKIPHQPSQAEGAYSACKSAMGSQLADKALRDEFMRTVYPKLPLAQRLILQ